MGALMSLCKRVFVGKEAEDIFYSIGFSENLANVIVYVTQFPLIDDENIYETGGHSL